jgi:hypothetical protein
LGYSNANSYSDTYTYSDTYSDTYSNAHTYSNSNTYSDTYPTRWIPGTNSLYNSRNLFIYSAWWCN